MIRTILFLASLLSLPTLVFGQGVAVPPATAFKVVNGITQPFSGATITVCAAATSGIPCSPVLTGALFFDTGLTQPKPNPFQADSNGNYAFAISPGTYTITITGTGFAGYSYQMTSPGTGSGGGGGGGSTNVFANGAVLGPLTFATLPASAANGTVAIISDGTAGPACSAGGAGAIAFRVAGAWTCDSPISGYLGAFTVATLPTASSNTSQLVRVTDGLNGGDCVAGGGSTSALCMSNGSSWISVGGSGLPSATQAGQFPVSTGAGTAYAAQTKGHFDLKDYGCVADDSTNNATCFTNAAAAVNAYAGTGRPTLFCGMGVGETAYKSSAGLAFTIPAVLEGSCVIDYSGTGNEITLGPTNLVAFSAAQQQAYEVNGIQHIGGASAAEGIVCSKYVNCKVMFNHWTNWGSTTNYAFFANAPNPALEIGSNYWMSGTGGGQNFANIVEPNASCVGSDTTFFHHNYLQGKSGGLIASACSGIGLIIGGAHSKISDNSFFGFNAGLQLSNEQCNYGVDVTDNAFDTATCSLGGVNSNIQLGDATGGGNINGLQISGNELDGFSGGFLFKKAAAASSVTIERYEIFGNRSLVQPIPLYDSTVTLGSGGEMALNQNFTYPSGAPLLSNTAGLVKAGSTPNLQAASLSVYSSATQIASDNCTRANGTLGANWTVNNGAFQILSNTCAANSAATPMSLAYWNASSFPADQFSSVTVATLSTNSTFIGPAVRVSTSGATTAYFALFNNITGGNMTFGKLVAGTRTNINTFTETLVIGDTLTITAQGSLITLFRNGFQISQFTDTSIASGAAGMVGFASDGTVSASAWSGGSLAGFNNAGGAVASAYGTVVNCAAVGSAANPSVAACGSANAGSVSCATAASGGTCTVNSTAVTANSEILILQRADTTTGTRLGVTCNTTKDSNSTAPQVTAVTAATSFTFQLGTVTTNPECFSYQIVN